MYISQTDKLVFHHLKSKKFIFQLIECSFSWNFKIGGQNTKRPPFFDQFNLNLPAFTTDSWVMSVSSSVSASSDCSSVIQASNSRSVLDLLDPVVLEVGNHVYKTTASTLKKIPNTYFSAMLSGQYPLVRQSDGSFFIDRDGKHFGSILSFMRSGYIAKPRDRIERKEVLLEAEYYCLKDAILSSWVRLFRFFSEIFVLQRFNQVWSHTHEKQFDSLL